MQYDVNQSVHDCEMDMEPGKWSRVFDEIKAKEGLTSDSKLAQSLGVSRTFICAVRKNRKDVSNEFGNKLFKRLGRRITQEDLELFIPTGIQETADRRVDPRTKAIVFRRANGVCAVCAKPAPFSAPDGKPYLEAHHILPSVLGGRSGIDNVVALCPNCHRKAEICPSIEDMKLMAVQAGRELDLGYLRRLEDLVSESTDSS